MPPEPLPWDRKDLFKERKHERSEFLGHVSRWRDSSNHGSREFSRWGSGDFRRPPGHGRQGGWHLFSDEYGHGYGPSMSFSNKMLENVSSRPSVSHGDGKYARNGRENRSFSQRDWKGHSWATSTGSTSNCDRQQHDLNYDNRSVHDVLIYPSHYHSDYVNSRDKVKGQHDKTSDINGVGTNQRRDREHSLSSSGWKPLKWTRSGGLSSRSSTSGHLSSTKSTGALDSNETKSETVMKNVTRNLSRSGDPADCVMSAPSFDDTSIRKKPRLGWGEGLAKYEKKKIELPDSAAFSNGNAESTHSLSSGWLEKGPKGSGLSDCTSPATPSSVFRGSSPGGDEKSYGKAASVDVSNLHCSPGSGFQNQDEGPSFSLEKLDNFSIANLGSPLIQLLQSNDSSSTDSASMGSNAMNKLLMYKNEFSEVLEMTESEIDLLENELKGLRSENRDSFSYPSTSGALLVKDKCFNGVSNFSPLPATLQVVTSEETISKMMTFSTGNLDEAHVNPEGKDIYSPGRLDGTGLVSAGENPSISGCKLEDDVMASVDRSFLIKSEAVELGPISSDVHEFADKGDSVFNLILASNKESARRASEALIGLLPADEFNIDIWSRHAPCSQNQHLLKERFAKKKQFLRFKERVITLKFRAFQSLWKEKLHMLPVRKLRAKSHKKYQLSLWTNHSGYHKNRSSSRHRLYLPAGNLNPVPNSEILKHVSKELSNFQVTRQRKTLKMPALILDQKDKMSSMFSSKNGLVEDPCAVERERMMINPWTSEEKDVFMEKLARFGKDFGKIASFLDHKTVADCVEFYYKNHKSDCFEKMKKAEFGKKEKSSTSTYLVTTGKKWNHEMKVSSLDMLSVASVMSARSHSNMGKQHKYSGSRLGSRRTEYHSTQFDDSSSERAGVSDILGNEREKVAADVLAGISNSLHSKAVNSYITKSFDQRDGSRFLKRKKGSPTVLRWCVTDASRIVDESCSDESCAEMDSYWTDGERSLFIEAVLTYGKNFSMISAYVGTKSVDQCKVFFSKGRKCLGLDLLCPRNRTPPGNDDNANGASEASKDGPRLATGTCEEPVKESDNSSSKIDHINAIVDSSVSDGCNGKDGPCLAVDGETHFGNSADDRQGLAHNQQSAAGSMNAEPARETSDHLDVSAASKGSVNGTEEQAERSNVETTDKSGKSHLSSSALVKNAESLHQKAVELVPIKNPHDERKFHLARGHLRSLSDSVRSAMNDDVKLFGQILSQSKSNDDVKLFGQILSQSKSNDDVKLFGQILSQSKSESNENGHRTQLHHKFKRRLKVKSHPNLGTATKSERDGSQKAPSRSYGIWDGNSICTGLPSLPDSASILIRYPSAFDRYSMSASEKHKLDDEPQAAGITSLTDKTCRDPSGKEPSQDIITEEQKKAVYAAEKQMTTRTVGEIRNEVSDTVKLPHDNAESGELHRRKGI